MSMIFKNHTCEQFFGYVGITDMHFVNAQPMDVTRELREIAVTKAIEETRSLEANTDWNPVKTETGVANPVELKPKPIVK